MLPRRTQTHNQAAPHVSQLLVGRAHALRVAITLVAAARARVQLSRLDAEGVGLGGGVFTVVVIITGLGGGGAVEGLRRHRRRDSLGVENDRSVAEQNLALLTTLVANRPPAWAS